MFLPLTDEQAMWRLQTRDDEAAFARLLQHWQEPIRRLCARMTGDLHLAEDLAQETFARVFLRRHDFTHGNRFSTWLWRIAVNVCLDAQRRRRRRPEHPLPEDTAEDEGTSAVLASGGPTPADLAAGQDAAVLVQHALLSLPQTHRSVVVLRHYEGLKFREIAEILDVPEGTVKSRMADALSHLGRRLQPLMEIEPRRHTASPGVDAPERL